jgi:hypothetical protein
MSILTLALAPRGAEARFWAEAGTPAYMATDRWTLIVTAFNVAAHSYGAWYRSFHTSNERGPRLLEAIGPAVAPALVAAALAARLLLAVRPPTYARLRTRLAVGQRLGRSVPQVVSWREGCGGARALKRAARTSGSFPAEGAGAAGRELGGYAPAP